MPTYDYECIACTGNFEELVFGAEEVACPHCHSTRVERRLSTFSVGAGARITGDVIDAARLSAGMAGPPPGACGSCGDPRGPGSCD